MRALVTGGAGFIGSHLVERLAGEGVTVRMIDDFSTGRRENLRSVVGRVEVVAGDLLDAGLRARACAGVDTVFHLAALTSAAESAESAERAAAFQRVNLDGSRALFASAADAGVERLVFASSAAVYGASAQSAAVEGEEGEPLSPYAAAKREVEREAARRARTGAVPAIVSLRLFNVYGPRQDPAGPYAAAVPAFVSAARAGRPATIFGDGLQTRDFVYVSDVVAAFLLAARAPESSAAGEVFNIGSGSATTIRELAHAVRDLVPGAPPPLQAPARAGDVRHSRASLDKARRALGWEPRVRLEEGLAHLLRAAP